MKKKKSKSTKVASTKHLKKELISKLEVAFATVVSEFGKAKKSTKLIEKFAKELSKKVNMIVKDDSLLAFAKEDVSAPEEIPAVVVAKAKAPAKQKKTAKV